jgi:hypothetical protein
MSVSPFCFGVQVMASMKSIHVGVIAGGFAMLAASGAVVGICCAAEIDPFGPKSVPTVTFGQERQSHAVLYEEDRQDPNGRKFDGSVAWRVEQVAPGSVQSSGTAVRAHVEIPERGLALRWLMQRNDDTTLSASHTIEIMFTLSPDFPHGGIASVPGVLMKLGEATRGTPLVGISAAATNNSFLVALSSVDADMRRNLQFLKERPWFDIPIVFADGVRAIVAIAKGADGERAFAEAFAAWEGAVATLPNPLSATPNASEPIATDQVEQNSSVSSEPPTATDPITEPKRVRTIKIPVDAGTLKSWDRATPMVRGTPPQ